MFWAVTLERRTCFEPDEEIRSTLELIFINDELAIFKEFEDVAFNKQKELVDLGQEIWLKVTLFIKTVASEIRSKGEFIFSKIESLMSREPEPTVKMNASASLESMFVT